MKVNKFSLFRFSQISFCLGTSSKSAVCHENITHPDVFVMESYNEDQETPSGQADGTVDKQGTF